jgi:putative transposase
MWTAPRCATAADGRMRLRSAHGCTRSPPFVVASVYRRLHILLRREGILLNHKKLRRLYAEERLQVRRRGSRKRALSTRAPLSLPQGSISCMTSSATVGASAILAVVDDFTRECLAVVADTSLSGQRGRGRTQCHHCPTRQARRLPLGQWERADQHGDPELVAGDRRRMALHRTPGKPQQNALLKASTAGCATNC